MGKVHLQPPLPTRSPALLSLEALHGGVRFGVQRIRLDSLSLTSTSLSMLARKPQKGANPADSLDSYQAMGMPDFIEPVTENLLRLAQSMPSLWS